MPLRIPARNVGGDQIMESSTNANSREEQHFRIAGGVAPTTTSGTITTATSTVTTGDVSVMNNVTVVIAGTYAGVNVTFEASPDAGTTWVPIMGGRMDGTGSESTTGVIQANTIRGWEFTLPAVNRFRVRATAYTSGTANVIVAAGAMPLEPVVNTAPTNINTTTGDTGTKTATFAGQTQYNYNARGMWAVVQLGTVSGTSPTMSCQLQVSYDGGTTFVNVGAALANLTATNNTGLFGIYPTNQSTAGSAPAALTTGFSQILLLNMPLIRTWRINYTIGGTSPSFALTNVWVNYIL